VFDVIGPVTLPHESAYYGTDKPNASGDDQYIADFVVDACKAADSLGVDFTQYDNDEDGIVDFVYIVYAGVGQADGGASTTIWPHNWDLISALYYENSNQTEYYAYYDEEGKLCYNLPSLDGKMLYLYACSNELKYSTNARTGIGTICHEFSHVLGLPDYYLTTTSPVVNQRETPGAWSLMGYGNYLNDGNTPPNYSVYDKYYLGWLEPEVLAQTKTLEIPADGVTTYMLASSEKHVDEGAYRTDTVYYIENRQQEGWDAYLPGHGMLIWRVIFNEDDWYQNCPNDHVARYRLISAVTASSPYTTTKPKPEVPFPGSKNITKYTPFSHNGLYNIQEANGLITCEFTTTTIHSAVENIQVPRTGVWYNILGQPIDPNNYKGVAIHDNKKYLLR
jgi:M6 family metalloprotease-like protein